MYADDVAVPADALVREWRSVGLGAAMFDLRKRVAAVRRAMRAAARGD